MVNIGRLISDGTRLVSVRLHIFSIPGLGGRYPISRCMASQKLGFRLGEKTMHDSAMLALLLRIRQGQGRHGVALINNEILVQL